MLLKELSSTEAFLSREQELHSQSEQSGREVVWVWETKQYSVVLGRSSKAVSEVHLAACNADGVPVLQRGSGGGTVVLGLGCLNYSLVLSFAARPELQPVADSYRPILEAVLRATGVSDGNQAGTDLMVQNRKFSGCSQRRMRHTLLHHGTLLYAFDLDRVSRYLRQPVRQPVHRQARTHAEFLTNVPLRGDFATRLAAEFPQAQVIS